MSGSKETFVERVKQIYLELKTYVELHNSTNKELKEGLYNKMKDKLDTMPPEEIYETATATILEQQLHIEDIKDMEAKFMYNFEALFFLGEENLDKEMSAVYNDIKSRKLKNFYTVDKEGKFVELDKTSIEAIKKKFKETDIDILSKELEKQSK